jgi:thioredoxin-related protein
MLKYYFLTYFLSIFTFSIAQEKINWISWEEMVEKRAADSLKKKVFIDMYTGWCGWCKKMDASTFRDPNIVKYMNQNYYSVKFDAESRDTINFNNHQFINTDPNFVKSSPNSRGKTHWFAHSLLDGSLSYPSYVILDENLSRLMIYKGYKDNENLFGILLFFSTDQHKYYHNYLNETWQKSLKK